MARPDWKRYYGVVVAHRRKPARVFVLNTLYHDGTSAREAVRTVRGIPGLLLDVIGVVALKGRTGKEQRELWQRTQNKGLTKPST